MVSVQAAVGRLNPKDQKVTTDQIGQKNNNGPQNKGADGKPLSGLQGWPAGVVNLNPGVKNDGSGVKI